MKNIATVCTMLTEGKVVLVSPHLAKLFRVCAWTGGREQHHDRYGGYATDAPAAF